MLDKTNKYNFGLITIMRFLIFILLVCISNIVASQTTVTILLYQKPVVGATVSYLQQKVVSDSLGKVYLTEASHPLELSVSFTGCKPVKRVIPVNNNAGLEIHLETLISDIEEVVVSGTLKAVNRMETPVPVEVYTSAYLKKNPTPNVFEALQNVNGVRPQLNCNVCNTGDIHINGLEGPYTLVLIDGMPIVSSLSSVYGLSGIPNSIIERIEIVKGPASSLYGSEAVGGLINIITKSPAKAATISADVFTTSWKETNADVSVKWKIKKAVALTGINVFNYADPVDHNQDGFTDITLQKRISVFNRLDIPFHNRIFSIAARYLYEDRLGGQMNWKRKFRGTDSVYGESIYTNRLELTGEYAFHKNLKSNFSYNKHIQNSFYGINSFNATQEIAFAQLLWTKKYQNHDYLIGVAARYTYYDDNTVATETLENNKSVNAPSRIFLPGIFLQDEYKISEAFTLLGGVRIDLNPVHGKIFTPRLALKYASPLKTIVRLNAGTGFRVVNLFTEDHAALTGARKVIIKNDLKPEKSYNINLNVIKKLHFTNALLSIDASVWYTHFQNRIIGDFETNPDQIIFDNLDGYAKGKGFTLNTDANFKSGIKIMSGITIQDVQIKNKKTITTQLLTEKISGTWAISIPVKKWKMVFDFTGNIYGRMRLPLLGKSDPRAPYSPVWSLQNIQSTITVSKNTEIYLGCKNIFNWTPARHNKMLIARAHDPFDKLVDYDANGNVMATAENPYALTFDPNYVYAPNQGRRVFIGIRCSVR